MNTKRIYLVWLLVLIILVSGCDELFLAVTGTQTTEPLVSPTSNTLGATTRSSPQNYQKNCIPIESTIPDGFLADGVIIYRDYDNGIDTINSFSTVDKQIRVLQSDLQWYSNNFTIDPTGKWMVQSIYDRNGGYDMAMDANGQEIGWFSDPAVWHESPLYWLNQRQLLFNSTQNPGSSYLAVDIFTGQAIELRESDLGISINPRTLPHYDPSLTRVVVQRVVDSEANLIRLGLWDIENIALLWETGDTPSHYYLQQPNWKLDGSGFVIGFSPGIRAEMDQLIIVDRDGVARQVTSFQDPNHQIFLPKWSPDGRYIVYWYGNSVTVYNTSTGISTDYCITEYSRIGRSEYDNVFYWSPDSQQVVFGFYGGPIVLDIQQNKAIQLLSLGSVIGWMVNVK